MVWASPLESAWKKKSLLMRRLITFWVMQWESCPALRENGFPSRHWEPSRTKPSLGGVSGKPRRLRGSSHNYTEASLAEGWQRAPVSARVGTTQQRGFSIQFSRILHSPCSRCLRSSLSVEKSFPAGLHGLLTVLASLSGREVLVSSSCPCLC